MNVRISAAAFTLILAAVSASTSGNTGTSGKPATEPVSGRIAAQATDLITSHAITSHGINSHANEQQCGDSSPRFITLGDQYFDVDPFELARSGATLQVDFDHFRKGDGVRTECFYRLGQYEARESVVALTDISVTYDKVTIALHDSQSHDISAIVIKVYEENDRLNRTRRQDVVVPLVNGDTPIESNTRRRQVTQTGSFLRESALSVSQHSNGLTLHQSTYVNGELAEWLTWNLYH